MNLSRKHVVLGFVLVATLAAAYMSPDPAGDASVVLTDRASRTTAAPAAPRRVASAGRAVVDVLEIRTRDTSEGDHAAGLFEPGQWQVDVPTVKVAPIVPVAVAPAAPLAPPLPFRAIGRYEEDGAVGFFIQHNDRNLVVRLGDTIDGQYKVERVQGNVLTLTHLPTNQTQTLDVGGAS